MLSGMMGGMDHDEPVPEADALEQRRPADWVGGPGTVGDRPEADAVEQQQPVVGARPLFAHPDRDDVPEADWLEQSIDEPFDDDER